MKFDDTKNNLFNVEIWWINIFLSLLIFQRVFLSSFNPIAKKHVKLSIGPKKKCQNEICKTLKVENVTKVLHK
jgi:hypothetical protein